MTSSIVDSPQVESEKRGPGRPRSARADEAIVEAVLDLLAEGTTVEALSIEAVASRAGVGKATIYRRWSSKDALIIDAIAGLKGPIPELAGVSVRDDIITILAAVLHARRGRGGEIMPCLVPEVRRNPSLYRRYQAAIEPRREVLREVLRRGIRTGELRTDIDIEMAMLMIMGPMVMQTMLDWNPNIDVDDTLAPRLADAALSGLRP